MREEEKWVKRAEWLEKMLESLKDHCLKKEMKPKL